MTTWRSDTPQRHGDGTPPQPDRIGLGGPGDLIAALPGLLGFVPEDSLVLVLLGGGSGRQVVAALRQDLPVLLAHPEAVDDLAQRLRCMRREETFDVLAVIVDGAWEGPAVPEACHDWLVQQLLMRFGAAPIEVVGAVVASAVADGAPWSELPDGERCGTVPDPHASDLTATHVFHGRTIHGSRAEIEAVLSPDPLELREALVDELGRIAGGVLTRRRTGGAEAVAAEFDDVLAAVAQVDTGDEPSVGESARAALALGNAEVRDAAMGLAVGGKAVAARRLWGMLARRLEGVLRAESAALLAFTAYAAGDGTEAGVAVDAALQVCPGHGLAGLLDEALSLALHPERIRELAEYAVESSAAEGLVVPWLPSSPPARACGGEDGAAASTAS
ncbi:DUF4192 domain-containing protein [Tomitella fengzijianii]|uniref:DUF4192 domain-containing protein n=1 Tax=Tomitella fengzijianii TaxID=2597660 RepID=A0A516X3H3_9ACTN|nr:DUF4192 domain-containing protein [Tomitella fengzijianii]QDQ97615.1 DUF4192 domain-containing protein [Tomitella fengzijianii]